MKEWALAFVAAASLVALTLWTTKVMVKVLYG